MLSLLLQIAENDENLRRASAFVKRLCENRILFFGLGANTFNTRAIAFSLLFYNLVDNINVFQRVAWNSLRATKPVSSFWPKGISHR